MGKVRPAERADGTRCAEICAEALAELEPVRGGPLFSRREAGLVVKALLRPGGLDRLLADGRRKLLVSLDDERIVGLALGRLEDVGEVKLGIVDACYVEPPSRRSGRGRSLIEGLVGWFEAAGCRGVDAPALPGDRAMKQLFETSGFKARLLTMHRQLP